MIVAYLCALRLKHFDPTYIQKYQISKIYSCQCIASLFQEKLLRLSWIQYNLLKSRLERLSNFQIQQIFICSSDEEVARMLLLMLLLIHSIVYLQKKAFVFKTISNELNGLLDYNLIFIKSLASYFETDGQSNVD